MGRRSVQRRWGVLLVILAGLAIVFLPVPAAFAGGGERHVRIEAGNFAYNPGTLTVNAGDRVTLDLVATDVAHGLHLDGYDIDLTADPGQTARLTFVADRAGTFRFRCSVTCGALHPFMIGKLHVGPNALLWKSIAIATLGLAVMLWKGTRK